MCDWPWTRREIGISRTPTTVIAVMPLRHCDGIPDWTADRMRIYRFQRRAFRFAQTIPETVGGPLDDYGAVFVTSADERVGRLARKGQIQETARKIRQFAERELEAPVRVGIGESVEPGRLLHRSYRQAVVSLYLRSEGGPSIAYYDEGSREKQWAGHALLMRQLDLLKSAYSESRSDLEPLKEAYLRSVLSQAFQDYAEVRWHFLYALDRIADAVVRRFECENEDRQRIRDDLVQLLEDAANLQEVTAAFRTALSRLEELSRKGIRHRDFLDLEQVCAYVNAHYKKPLRIRDMARMAGVSISTFSRSFRKRTGKGFEQYMQDLRMNEARRLLRMTNLPVSQIVKECGFQSNSYFVRFFRSREGMTPQTYRKGSHTD